MKKHWLDKYYDKAREYYIHTKTVPSEEDIGNVMYDYIQDETGYADEGTIKQIEKYLKIKS